MGLVDGDAENRRAQPDLVTVNQLAAIDETAIVIRAVGGREILEDDGLLVEDLQDGVLPGDERILHPDLSRLPADLPRYVIR